MPLSKITAASISDNSVTTAKVADDAITGAKIENNPTIAGNLTVSGSFAPSKNTSNKNMLINGGMRISQRNGTSAVTVSAAAGVYTLDRWQLYTNSGNYSVQQITDTTLPSGFLNAAKITVSSVGNTSGSGNAVHFEQKIEGNNISHLNWGGGNAGTARTCTLSFFVKSSVTGTYSVHLGNDNDRFYIATYTIDSANTWEKKSITLAGPSDGTWNTGTGRGLEIVWVLLQGSGGTTSSLNQWISTSQTFASTSTTQWGTNAGATFYLTGCQFEISSVATPFEHESYTNDLAKCQRYFVMDKAGTAYKRYLQGVCTTATWTECLYYYPVTMRAQPSLGSSGTNGHYLIEVNSGASASPSEAPSRSSHSDTTNCIVNLRVSGSTLTTGANCQITSYNTTSGYLSYDAEL